MELFHKLTTLAKATSHDLLDKAIDWNSPSMLRQFARDLESETERLSNEAATQAGLCRSYERQLTEYNSRLDQQVNLGKTAKANNNATAMAAAAQQILILRPQITQKEQDVAAQRAASAQIDVAVSKLKAKSQEVNARVHSLESLDSSSKVKASAAAALGNASKVLQVGGSIDVDNIEEHIRTQNDINSTKLDRALGEFDNVAPGPDQGALDSVMASF
jgi:phage shock protein A